jgi:predicted histidine transporter YuiF (NhaC family)
MNDKVIVIISVIAMVVGFFVFLWLLHEEVKKYQNSLMESVNEEEGEEEEGKEDWDT